MTTLPGAAASYWMISTEPTAYATLAGDTDVDVAVVGGGIAGICTAWELARTGRSVAVLEAGRVLADVTGHTTAKLTALHTTIYAHLKSSFGADAARRYAESQQDAIATVVRTATALDLDCDLERRTAYTYTESTAGVDHLHAEAAAAQEAGLPAAFVTETGLPYLVSGAVRVLDQAQFHPRRYLLGLADDLTRQGGRIFEQTRVVDFAEGDPCRLTTEAGGTVTARAVVVATGYPIFDRALLFSRLTPRRELVVAATMPAEQDPDGMYITTEENTRSVRTAPWTDGKRLLIVTGEAFRPGSPGVAERFGRLAAWTMRRFGVPTIEYHWAAQDNATTDRVPYVGRLHPGTDRVWVATGFGGWGMTNGVMAGRLLAALISGQDKPTWTDLYDPRRIHPTVEAASFIKGNLDVARHFVGDRFRVRSADSVDTLAPGTGAVVKIEGERRAVYRDDDNELHAVSATCTHLGCTVAFNDAERTWDCPCHGSRFDVDGAVLHGPATRPLPARRPVREAPG